MRGNVRYITAVCGVFVFATVFRASRESGYFLCVASVCIAENLVVYSRAMDRVCTCAKLRNRLWVNCWSISAICEGNACSSWTNVSMRFVCLSYARART